MSTERTPAKRFRAFALNCGTDENDPSLLQAVQELRKFELGDATAEEVDSAVGPLFGTQNGIKPWVSSSRYGGTSEPLPAIFRQCHLCGEN